MKWEFESFKIEAINKNKTLASMDIRINGIEHCLFVVKEKKGIRIDRFFPKNTELKASHYEMLFMLWWLDEVFKYKSLPLVHNSEELHYRFVRFRCSKDLSEFFEFEKIITQKLTLVAAEDSVPEEIENLVKEIELQTAINIALDNGDKETFMLLTSNQEVTT